MIKQIRRYLLPVLALLGVAAAIVMVSEGNRTPPATKPVFQPAEAPFSAYIFGPGIVEASTENIAIGTPVSGIVKATYVTWGEQVKRGAPLFQIDTRDLDAQLLPARAKVREVEAQLSSAIANVAQAKQALAKAENHLKVGEALVPGVSISSEDLANRKMDVATGEAQLASAEGQVRQINAQVASAAAQVKQIEDQIRIRTVRAPVAGSILQLQIRPGEFAQSGALPTPLLVLGNDTTLHVRVDIDQSDAWRFQANAPAVAFVRGNANLKTTLNYVRTDPNVVPQTLLTGDATQRTDTRVLQVIYRFDSASLQAYVGQLMDVFIQASPPPGTTQKAPPDGGKS
ncbi:MAG TPA: HlyD family efflux transporter periplasmic adaptor subunit [Terriglobales bacterium]|nr:HlyD family efflux transporter periplasmic adaptor subunit [Terriglobales bacterium]